MRDRLTEASFDDFLSQEAQGPAVMAFWCIATRQCRDFGALSAINDNRTARTRRIVQTVQPFGAVAVAPSGDRGVGHIERFSHRTQGLAAIEFEQRGRALESLDRERTFGKQSFKRGAVVLCQGQVIFTSYHQPIRYHLGMQENSVYGLLRSAR